METAQEILKLIEAVDPSDTAKLDEIDARVACLLQDHVYGSEAARFLLKAFPQYTRSRDALKAIRPKDWRFSINWITGDGKKPFGSVYGEVWKPAVTGIFVKGKYGEFGSVYVSTDRMPLPTEELAELHAIIQAINYERITK